MWKTTAMSADQEQQHTPPPQSTTALILSTTPPTDPPPPYPSRERRSTRTGTQRRRRRATVTSDSDHLQVPTAEDDEHSPVGHEHFTSGADESGGEYDGPPHSALLGGSEDMLALHVPASPSVLPPTPRIQTSSSTGGGSAIGRRPRTLSVSSTPLSIVSAAPSFAQTVMSAFHPDRDDDLDPDCIGDSPRLSHEAEDVRMIYDIDIEDEQAPLLPESSRLGRRRSSHSSSLYKYFRPMFKRPYYSALFHLLVLNFPYALTAWVYLFVFTLVSVSYSAFRNESHKLIRVSRPARRR